MRHCLRCNKETDSLFCSYECKDSDSAEQAERDARRELDKKKFYCEICKGFHREYSLIGKYHYPGRRF